MEWKKAVKVGDGKVDVPSSWLFPHYYEALTVLFRVENALRLLVYLVLKEQFGPKWKDLEIASDEEAKTSIAALARRRIEQGRTFGYLSYPIQSPLMHMTSGELVRLIIHDAYWPVFKDYFFAARNVVTLKLQEIGTIRNALAHFRPLSPNDVEVVKLNANQMLSEVERTLIEIIQCAQGVPTNTTDEWYVQLRTLGTDQVKMGFSQSKDERWVRLNLSYKNVVVSGNPNRELSFQRYRITNVDTPAILETQSDLRNHVIFVTERIPLIRLSEDLLPQAQKVVGLTFSRRILLENYAQIKQSLERVLGQLNEETELLREDQLARGRLVQVVGIVSRASDQQPTQWTTNRRPLESSPPNEELPEYWGRITATSDFISDTEDYPWMPVKISEDDIPF
jgi:hypothetical protein